MFNDTTIYKTLNKFHEIFSHEKADEVAKSTGLIQRCTSKLLPLHFLILLVIEMLKSPAQALSSMTDSLASMKGGSRITPQALAQRLQSVCAVKFLKRCYSFVLEKRLKVHIDACTTKGILGRFSGVLIEDSTSCVLHQKVKEFFRGVGGGASKAGYKIHLLWDCVKSDVQSLILTGSSVTDQSMASNVLRSLKRGTLIIRDLGYFSIPIFAQIHEKGSFFFE